MEFSDQANGAGLSPDEEAELLALLLAEEGFQAPAAAELVAAQAGATHPLSFAQQRLWFLQLMTPESPFYNMPAAIDLRGPLHRAALEQALNALVARHQTLRTTFLVADGQPLQRINDSAPITLPVRELAAGADRDAMIEQLIAAEISQPFDLEHGPLIRAALVPIAPEHHLLLITLHHIIADGWSIGVMIREIGALYAAFAAGLPAPLAPLPIQYVDFAHWQREWLAGPQLAAELAYWREHLAGSPDLELPADRPRPAVAAYQGAQEPVALPAPLVATLRSLGQQHGATLFMTLLAGFKALLYRYSEQTDLVVGTAIANRTRVELEPLIGFFVNSLVLRTELDPRQSFHEAIERVKATTLAAYAHQHAPFEKLVEELRPERAINRNPLFQISFVLQNAPLPPMELAGLAVRARPVHNGTAKFDLFFDLFETADGVNGVVEYDTALFEQATIQRMIRHFALLLEHAAARPALPLRDLPLVSAEEAAALVAASGASFKDWAAPELGVHDLVAAQAACDPGAIAVIWDGRRLSYGELDMRANQVAHALIALGAKPDSLIALHMERGIDLVAAMLAVLKAGAAYLPLDPAYPPQRNAAILGQAAPAILLTSRALRERLPAAVGTQTLCADDPEIDARPATDPAVPFHPRQLAYVLFTSGSTGVPKGVAIEHASLAAFIEWSRGQFSPAERAGVLASTSVCFDISVFEIWMPLCCGGTVIGAANVLHVPEQVDGAEITLINTVPSALSELLRAGRLPASVRTVNLAGEALPGALAAQLYALGQIERLYNLYGPTEDTVYSTFQLASREPAAAVPIGRPLAGTRAYILDQRRELVPAGVPGELYLAGAGLARGYLGDPLQTAQSFVPDPFSGERGARMYKTGDRVRADAEGRIHFLGRIDQQIKLRGFRIELKEIESVLHSHPDVAAAVAVVREQAAGDHAIAAYVVPRDTPASPLETEEHTAAWSAVFDHAYAEAAALEDGELTAVWRDSYEDQPLPTAEMREWVATTVARVRERQPRRVLELGCGTGLLLFELAGGCDRYDASDVSAQAVQMIENRRALLAPRFDHVRLVHAEAADLAPFQGEHYDVIILNSVVQYFPSIAYLAAVLRQAAALLAPGGTIMVGDVRHRGLQATFQATVALHRAAGWHDLRRLRDRIDTGLRQEGELCIHPLFFAAVLREIPALRGAAVMPRRGTALNELTRFRYDAFLSAAEPAGEAPAEWRPWAPDLALAAIEALLREPGRTSLRLADVANSRLSAANALMAALEGQPPSATVHDLRAALAAPPGLNPEDLWALGERLGYRVAINWLRADSNTGAFDVWMDRSPAADPPGVLWPATAPPAPAPLADYASDPRAGALARSLGARLRAVLAARLPEYMVPASITVLGRLPLTPNGKLDRRALPAPERASRPDGQAYAAPRSELEQRLADIWQEVLNLPRVGVEDNFFDLGGHSLLLARLHAALPAIAPRQMPLVELFKYPTIRALAAALADAPASAPAAQSDTRANQRRDALRQQRQARQEHRVTKRGHEDA
jgi:amino acid adenylation domain-containing protein